MSNCKQCCRPSDPVSGPPTARCTDLELNIRAIPFPTSAPSVVNYFFDVRNNGPVVANNVILTIAFSGNPIGFFPPEWDVGSNSATIELGNLAVNETESPNFIFSAAQSSIVLGTAFSSTPDCDVVNNSDTASFIVDSE